MAEAKYQKYLITNPLRTKPTDGHRTEGMDWPVRTYISDKLIPRIKQLIEVGWIWDIPNPNPIVDEHTHDFDEIFLLIGTDLANPEDLGAELEFMVDGEPIKIDKTSALYVPKGVKHGPQTWKRVDRPHMQVAIILGSGNISEIGLGGLTYKDDV